MIFEIIGLLLAIPAGYFIAWLARDELVDGRRWFVLLIILSAIGAVFFYFSGKDYLSLTFGFILIVSAISLLKSKDKRWTGKKI